MEENNNPIDLQAEIKKNRCSIDILLNKNKVLKSEIARLEKKKFYTDFHEAFENNDIAQLKEILNAQLDKLSKDELEKLQKSLKDNPSLVALFEDLQQQAMISSKI